MKYAVMSDVHANPAALAKALDDAKEDGSVDVELRKLTFDYLGCRDSLLAANADVPIWLEDLVSRLGCSK